MIQRRPQERAVFVDLQWLLAVVLTLINFEHMFVMGGGVARPEKIRRVGCAAGGRAFKPIGRRVGNLEVEELRLDEFEALRLADLEGLYQEAAAERMGVSRPTFARILARARSAVARALVEGRVLVIGEGPVIEGPQGPLPCAVHEGGRRRGRGCHCRNKQGPYRFGRVRSSSKLGKE